jgi:hypothetical protein
MQNEKNPEDAGNEKAKGGKKAQNERKGHPGMRACRNERAMADND